ncbi:MAG: MMPL family transporter [Opitutaceae bacterium]
MKSRITASVFLLLLFIVSAGWLLSLDWKARLSTNVMELIPERSPSPELALGRSVLADVYANRVMVAMRDATDARSVDAYVECLKASPLVDKVINLNDVDAFADIGQFVFEQRFELLFPKWFNEIVDENMSETEMAQFIVQRLEEALNDPTFVVFEEIVPSDPLLLMRDVAGAFQNAQPANSIDTDTYLLEVTLSVSSLEPEGQQPVFDLLAAAELAARGFSPNVRVLDTGAHRYAAETETEMRREVQLLNLSTMLVVFLICVFVCRRIFLVFHVFLILTLSLVSGLALMIGFFDQVHVFALIFGCVLCGVIVDYGLHAYLHEAGRGQRSLNTFLKPFLISCGSTLMGFSILLLSDLPVLRQMGLLVVCGLFMAVIVTLVYVFGVLRSAPEIPVFSRARSFPRWGMWLVWGVGAGSLVVLPFVSWEDDIRNLKYPLPHLDEVDAQIRNLHGGERQVLLTIGEDYVQSRQNVEALHVWLEGRGATNTQTLSARAWVPTFDAYVQAGTFAQEHPNFADQVLAALASNGYDREAFEPFTKAWRNYRDVSMERDQYEALVNGFSVVLAGGLSGIVGANDTLHWWVTLVDDSIELSEMPDTLQSLRLSQVESMSTVLSQYRARTLELSMLGGAVMYVVLLFAFGLRDGTRLFALPLVAVISASVLMYYFFGALGIFHLIGLFLGACLVLDYAVFSWMGVVRDGCIPVSVIVSALTTVASFFILCWSQIPSIHALGLAVAMVTFIGALSSCLVVPQLAQKKEAADA